jgi:hypothetical protein
LQAHCQSRTRQRYNQSFVKKLAKPPNKNFFFFFPPFGVLIFFANAHATTDKHFDSSEHKQKGSAT